MCVDLYIYVFSWWIFFKKCMVTLIRLMLGDLHICFTLVYSLCSCACCAWNMLKLQYSSPSYLVEGSMPWVCVIGIDMSLVGNCNIYHSVIQIWRNIGFYYGLVVGSRVRCVRCVWLALTCNWWAIVIFAVLWSGGEGIWDSIVAQWLGRGFDDPRTNYLSIFFSFFLLRFSYFSLFFYVCNLGTSNGYNCGMGEYPVA